MAPHEYSASNLERLLLQYVAFVSLDSLPQCGMLSGHVYFHSRCFMGVQNVVNCGYRAGGSLDWIEYLPGASIEGMVG